jgi:hypothetical protein
MSDQDKVPSSEALHILYYFMQTLMRKEAWEDIDDFMKRLDVKISSPIIMVGILRYSFANKEHLFQWDVFLSRVQMELDYRRLNIKELLQGLI